jgi:hypothetical protein
MFFRGLILMGTILLRGVGANNPGEFDGEEGTAGSAVGRGCWSSWWTAGKELQERALASHRPA